MNKFTDDYCGIVLRGRPFIKMHGLRNDFVIVDSRDRPYTPTVEEIVRICDRRAGVGGDELVVIEPAAGGLKSSDAYAFVRIFNPDGREAEACGNATRCVGWLFLQESGRDAVVIDTLGGKLACRRAGEKLVAVDMGKLRTARCHDDRLRNRRLCGSRRRPSQGPYRREAHDRHHAGRFG